MATTPPKKNATPAKKAPAKKPANRGTSRRPAGLFTWLAIGVVVVLIAVIVIVKATSSSPTKQSTAFVPASPTVVHEVTNIPASVFDAVGVTAPAVPVSQPSAPKASQKVLEWPDANGVLRPTVYYEGAEFCPYCAAERWRLIIALSRFGTFSDLGNAESSSTDRFPNTQTFTFLKAKYVSSYVNFSSIEQTDVNHNPLQTPNAKQSALFAEWDQNGSIPFISYGNQFFRIGSSYTPDALKGLSREQIAGNLNDSTNLLTQGIVSSANYATASICQATGNKPGNVCNSPGVKAAKSAMGIK